MGTPQVEIAKIVIVERFRQLARDYNASLARVANLNEMMQTETNLQAQMQAIAQDCHAAARVLGFDLVAEASAVPQEGASVSEPALEQIIPPPSPPPISASSMSIRDEVLERARLAYPAAVKATALRAELEKHRGALHEKTIGMTLYRLSRDGLVERDGRNWFFVPPEQRTKNPGGETPGQHLFDD